MFLYINISQTYVSSDNNISNHYHRHVSVYQYVANICFLRQQYQQPLSQTCFCISICRKHMFPQTTISATIITYMFLYINMSQTYVSSDNNISNHYHIHVSIYQYVANICFLRQQYQQPLSQTCFCISICRKHVSSDNNISNHYHIHVSVYQYVANICFLRQQYQQPLSHTCFCISICRKHMFPQTTISATIITDMFLYINMSQTCFLRQQYQQPLSHTCFCISICRKHMFPQTTISATIITYMFLYINMSQTYVSSDNNISNHYHRHVSVYQYVANICFLRQQYQQPLSHTCFCISICRKHMFPQTTISATIITYMFLYINMSQTYVSSDNNISNHYHIHVSIYQYVANICFLRQQYQQPLSQTCFCISICRKHVSSDNNISNHYHRHVSVYQYVANICFLRQQYQQPLSHTCFCISICRKHTFPQTTISATIITYMFLYINMSQTYVSFVVITIWSLPHLLHHNLILASSITSQSDPCLIHYITIWSLPHPLHITIWSLPHPLHHNLILASSITYHNLILASSITSQSDPCLIHYITIWSLPHPLHHNLILASSITSQSDPCLIHYMSQSDPCLIHYITIWSLPHPLHHNLILASSITYHNLILASSITYHNLILASSITYHRVCNKSKMASPTSRTGTAYPSATSEFNTPDLLL